MILFLEKPQEKLGVLENIKKFNLYNPTPDEYKKLFENAGFIDVKVHIKEDDNWICIEGHK